MKIKLVVITFTLYAIVWWDQLVTNCRRNYEWKIKTWDEMKPIMRRRLVLSHYYRELYQRLQSLSQSIKCADKYFKEMELVIIRDNVEKDIEFTLNCNDSTEVDPS